MDWKKERDELIAQTLAFVQSVTAKLPAAAPFEPAITEPRLPPIEPSPKVTAPPRVEAGPEPSVRQSAPAPSPQACSPPASIPQEPIPQAPSPLARSPQAPSPALPEPSVHSEMELEFRTRIASF